MPENERRMRVVGVDERPTAGLDLYLLVGPECRKLIRACGYFHHEEPRQDMYIYIYIYFRESCFFFPAGVVAAGCTEHEPRSLALSWCLWFPAKPNVPPVKHSSHVFLSQKESGANLSFSLDRKNM